MLPSRDLCGPQTEGTPVYSEPSPPAPEILAMAQAVERQPHDKPAPEMDGGNSIMKGDA